MADLTTLDHRLDAAAHTCLAIVETPRGTRTKYDYEPDLGAFKVKRLLPEGMAFPLDFGFIPSTLGGDGDPLDVMVLADEPGVVGGLLGVRLVGVIAANQTEGDNTVRNDRLLAVSTVSRLHARVEEAPDLGQDVLDQLTAFWVQYNALQGKRFEVIEVGGADAAVRCVQDGTVKVGR